MQSFLIKYGKHVRRKYNTSESQTNNIKCSDLQVQSYRGKEKECQTVISKDFSDYQHDNSDDLLNHLQKMENRMLKYLKCNSWNKTAAYFPINSDIDSSCMNSKKLKGVDNADDKMDHNDCCTDKTSINFWSVNRLESNNTQPDKYVEVAGCVVSLAYHYSIISIIACATFNGELSRRKPNV
ncbi:hypothetical protein HELRODRAFT_177244 [Helobdella robusta]|uniref:Uncharacterized protein n=1 Tax=Helobdella robusta TaxID=6412 RepID=T1FBE4_HELRO|nr:hypothetical protein HELRODRAFT_177244 [Helobdella robusta]ESN98361.1 hypothetical protein HELRODRAFT_177244 [Helobdella robusta]